MRFRCLLGGDTLESLINTLRPLSRRISRLAVTPNSLEATCHNKLSNWHFVRASQGKFLLTFGNEFDFIHLGVNGTIRQARYLGAKSFELW